MKSLIVFIFAISLYTFEVQGRILDDRENSGRLSDIQYQFLLENMAGLFTPKAKPGNGLSHTYEIPEEQYNQAKLIETEVDSQKPHISSATKMTSEIDPFERNRRNNLITNQNENCTEPGPCLNVMNLPLRLVCPTNARDNWTVCSIGGRNFKVHKRTLDHWEDTRFCQVSYKFEIFNNFLYLVVKTKNGMSSDNRCDCYKESVAMGLDVFIYSDCFINNSKANATMSSSTSEPRI